jgi:hypothetical protein
VGLSKIEPRLIGYAVRNIPTILAEPYRLSMCQDGDRVTSIGIVHCFPNLSSAEEPLKYFSYPDELLPTKMEAKRRGSW